MGKGKMCVQAGHASILAWVQKGQSVQVMADWLKEGQFKVVLKGIHQDHLEMVAAEAKKANLPVVLVHDWGFTEVAPDTLTCIAIGPALVEEVNKVTGHLPLL